VSSSTASVAIWALSNLEAGSPERIPQDARTASHIRPWPELAIGVQ
jgi:hypothetical protein